ncbi:acyltransferase family protein [Stutzerimonas stutzeri]|uniref:acyltransferase family protein n=1 Tax=Stutzerimonas stutzeri TaxID=316 RepID=UPI001CFCD18C|nr:acyltransferase family protein [Stutzerimonas stutzeri]
MSYQAHDSKSFYRPDIDGLRAIAVLAVVLFHIDPALIPGGFVGVDIFFVISGYLITGNIIKDALSPRGFSWSEFYRRRILRILPVLFVVLLTVLMVGQFVLLPADFQKLGYSTAAAVLSVANVYFTYFLDTSYFADDSSLQPLLHLWSLGVEEQFYLFWPMLLVVLIGRLSKPKLLLVAFLLAAASFVLAQALLKGSPMFAYYMLPARAGELLVGAMLAIWLSNGQRVPGKKSSIALGIIGMALIVASLAWTTEDKGFPGVAALPSTIGAALVILAGSGGVRGLGHLLALRPMVLIGLISYSLYLWHWPVLAFYRYLYGTVGALDGAALFVLMMVLSVLSYRVVEKPLRQLRWGLPLSFGLSAGVSIFAMLVCVGIVFSKGYGVYFNNDEYRIALAELEPAPPAYKYSYVCQRSKLDNGDLSRDSCVINPGGRPGVLLWGDSNAAHYVGVLGVIAKHEGFSFRNAAHSSCPPVFSGIEKVLTADRIGDCQRSVDVVRRNMNEFSTVIIGAAWEGYFNKDPSFVRSVESTIDTLLNEGKRVILLGQVPRFSSLDRSCHQKAAKLPFLSCTQVSDEVGRLDANNLLLSFANEKSNLEYFDLRSILCRSGRCSHSLNGDLLYFDNSHLSMEGSWSLGRELMVSDTIPSAFLGLGGSSNIDSGFEGFALSENPEEILLSVNDIKGWGGELEVGKSTVVLTDGDKDAYVSYGYRLPKLNFDEHGRILFRFDFSDCHTVSPLLRMKIDGYVYDALVGCDSGQLSLKGFSSDDARLVFEDGKPVVYLFVNIKGDIRNFMVSIFPSAGDLASRYSKHATGSVALRRISLQRL